MDKQSMPLVCGYLKAIAWLDFIGGVIGSFFFFGHQEALTSYGSVSAPLVVPGIISIASGIIGGVIFWAFSEILIYLDSINKKLCSLHVNEIEKTTKTEEEKENKVTIDELTNENSWECRCGHKNPKSDFHCLKCGRSFDAII